MKIICYNKPAITKTLRTNSIIFNKIISLDDDFIKQLDKEYSVLLDQKADTNTYVQIYISNNEEFSPCAIVKNSISTTIVRCFYPHDNKFCSSIYKFFINGYSFSLLIANDVYHFELAKILELENIDYLILIPLNYSRDNACVVKSYEKCFNLKVLCLTTNDEKQWVQIDSANSVSQTVKFEYRESLLNKKKNRAFCHPKAFKHIYQKLNMRNLP